MWTVPLTEFQQEYLRNCSHRWNVKTGATRSGKTYLDCAVTIPKRICAARGEGLLVLMGNTLGTLERNVLSLMRELWGPDLVGVIRTSAAGNVVQLFGKKVYVLGADNKKHIARIQGAAFEYVYGDEITTWDEGVFQMLKSRLSCPHSHFDGTCNPESPTHWFKKFLDSDADIYCQAYTIDDNPTLPAQFVADLKKEYTGTVYYNRFTGLVRRGGAGFPAHRPGGAGCRLSGRPAAGVLHGCLCPLGRDPIYFLRQCGADPHQPHPGKAPALQAQLAGRPGGEQCQDPHQ